VAKRFIQNFLKAEEDLLSKGNEVQILYVENAELQQQLDIPELDFPVYLRGKVDRVDALNGKTRVIDYKTGKVEPKNLMIKDWEDLVTDYEYSKAFQVLAYSSLLLSNQNY